MSKQFPPVQGGGSLMVAWQVRQKNVLVIGGGEVAASRILHALNADANVTVICPRSGLNDEVSYRISESQVKHIDRTFEPHDLDHADMVLCAIDDAATSTKISNLCRERRIPVNIADVPAECDFFFGSVHRDGPLQVMVSTNGNGPKMASIVRKQIAEALPERTGEAVEKVGTLRRKLREVAPDAAEGAKRMRWISKVCDSWTLKDLVDMTEEDMDILLKDYYGTGQVPSLEQIR
ncbi:hypothetical protein VTN49DRAFT_819 [Thermomyces lanuginosus]|uniref:uncharacterized protein n=1 Tax=Thermomyces lanuginosus TaxID=5541 RepID=UPI003741F31A